MSTQPPVPDVPSAARAGRPWTVAAAAAAAVLAVVAVLTVVTGAGADLLGRESPELQAVRADPMASWLPDGVRLEQELESDAEAGGPLGKPVQAGLTRVLVAEDREPAAASSAPPAPGDTDPSLTDPALHARAVEAATAAGWDVRPDDDRPLLAFAERPAPGGGTLTLAIDGYSRLRPDSLPSGAVAVLLGYTD
jgi:hypothetical protein